MYRILICIAAFAVIACNSTNNENAVTLFNDIAFSLEEGEQVKNTEQSSKDRYLEFTRAYPVQIPLYKHIQHRDYELYLGIPFHTSIDELLSHQLYPADSVQTVNKTDSTTYIYRKYYRDNQVLTEYIRKDLDNLVYVLNTTRSDSVSEHRFSRDALSERFAENKQ